ncbi:MAG: hypothetical protein Fur0025_42410 [Oscillatoriaceae cyanobacterium]
MTAKIVPLGYKTQASDTSIEAELVQFGLWRQLSPAQKEALFRRVAHRVPTLMMMQIQHQFPDASPGEIKRHYITRRLGVAMADLILANYPGALMMEDSIWLARRLAEILDSLHIPYYVGGSVASSLHGEVRYTEDLDLVVNIDATQVQALIDAMISRQRNRVSQPRFLVFDHHSGQETRFLPREDAMSGRMSSFNVIHLETTEKADIFLMKDNDFSRSQMARRQLQQVAWLTKVSICAVQKIRFCRNSSGLE